MSEELLLDLSAKESKPAKGAKKAPAKKAAAKKVPTKAVAVKEAPTKSVAAKKVPAKKAAKVKEAQAPAEVEAVQVSVPAAVVEIPASEAPATKKAKPARKSAVLKKAAEMLAQMQAAEAETPVEAPVAKVPVVEAPAPAPAVVEASQPVIEEAPVASRPIENPPVAQPESVAPRQHQRPYENQQAPRGPGGESNGQPGDGQPGERRKSKFERWKERRERFRQEKIARQQANGGNGQPYAPQPRHQNQEVQAGGDEDRNRPSEIPLGPPEPADGILELTPKGYGFLRQRDRMFIQHPNDSFISADFIRQYGLREGMQVKGVAQKGQRGLQITSVAEVNGRAPEAMRDLPLFEELKATNPTKKIQLETTKDRLTTRVIDMFTPVGRGQRGLIVAPPRAGKTTMLQHIAEAVVANHPGMHLMILLVDERPEEVTEFKRILPKAEIYASSNDQDIKSHTRIAAFAVERAKRLVECGEHVFMLMDSITRLARAFNNAKQGGATMSGGMGVGAMEIPRRLFAAARNTRQAGSLTVLATALVETGSRMDDLIFQEFKGTGNMELVLDRKIAEQFYYPAVNIFKSGTRREELLLQPFQLDKIHMLRRGLAGHKPIDAIQRVLTLMERYPSNAQMLVDLPNKS
ncbi:transcription termination factor Rho [Prosthecobacter dejongeii]|uniref:Transcription termination factor Rho n=1 Tax=Prosthecobacter dejongeii TaxID=48465 RepID=A0A7W7YPQ0_9BACT|nr:transcription termination factor Rho [Prosthecobacter dejongeii]MBB5040044.1 transcription termination factor Rho [Prosthecobacter dejongeii]